MSKDLNRLNKWRPNDDFSESADTHYLRVAWRHPEFFDCAMPHQRNKYKVTTRKWSKPNG